MLSFMIAFNRLSTELTARLWQLGVLRAVGLGARQVGRVLLFEGWLIGVAGAVIGVPAGVALGWLALPRVAAAAALNHDLVIPGVRFSISSGTVLLATSVAVVSSLLATMLAAWSTARPEVAEIVRLRGRGWSKSFAGAGWLRLVATAAMFSVAVALHRATRTAVWDLITTALIVVVTALAARSLVRLLRAPVARSLVALAGPGGDFARAAVLRNAQRAAVTVGLLGVGLGCVLWMRTLAASFEGTLADTLRATMGAPVIVTSSQLVSGWMPAALEDGILPEIVSVPSVEAVAANRIRPWTFAQRSVALNAFDPDYFRHPEFGRPLLVGKAAPDVWDALARGTGVLASTNFARAFRMQLHDRVTLDAPDGPLALSIVGFTPAFLSANGTLVMSRAVYRRHWSDQQVNRVWVRTRAGVAPEVVAREIENALAPRRSVRALLSGEMSDFLVSKVRHAFAPLHVAEAVVLLAALVAVLDTLAASVLQRRREIGIARAVGVQARQVERMLLAEGMLVAGLGWLLALGSASALGALWVVTTFPRVTGWVLTWHPPWGHALLVGLFALGVGLAGAVLPARWATRVAPALALQAE
jgi:putative ABC transport system permease protein